MDLRTELLMQRNLQIAGFARRVAKSAQPADQVADRIAESAQPADRFVAHITFYLTLISLYICLQWRSNLFSTENYRDIHTSIQATCFQAKQSLSQNLMTSQYH